MHALSKNFGNAIAADRLLAGQGEQDLIEYVAIGSLILSAIVANSHIGFLEGRTIS